ncbi:uncharacterized protein TRIVIDRAFT_214654, partial [Trichoderma virens Gv29-8]
MNRAAKRGTSTWLRGITSSMPWCWRWYLYSSETDPHHSRTCTIRSGLAGLLVPDNRSRRRSKSRYK